MIGPEFKHAGRVGQIGAGILFLRMNKIGEVDWVVQKEYGCVIPDQVKIPFIRIEFDSEAARIAGVVAGVLTAAHRGEAHEHFGFLAFALEEAGPGILR